MDFYNESNELIIGKNGNVLLLQFCQNGKEISTIAVVEDTLHRFAQTISDTSKELRKSQ